MTNVQLFNFNANQIRVVEIEGNPWFVAKDVCRVLGIVNTTLALRPLGGDEKGLYPIKTIRGVQSLNAVSESGLYKLVMRSDKPEARRFQDWVTKEVLPAIRKDGGYIMDSGLELLRLRRGHWRPPRCLVSLLLDAAQMLFHSAYPPVPKPAIRKRKDTHPTRSNQMKLFVRSLSLWIN